MVAYHLNILAIVAGQIYSQTRVKSGLGQLRGKSNIWARVRTSAVGGVIVNLKRLSLRGGAKRDNRTIVAQPGTKSKQLRIAVDIIAQDQHFYAFVNSIS
jgi:FAD/FMN-containing dehydrogenase